MKKQAGSFGKAIQKGRLFKSDTFSEENAISWKSIEF